MEVSGGIQFVHVAGAERRRRAAGPQIRGFDIGEGLAELDVGPSAPSTRMAPIGLSIREFLSEALPRVAQPRRVHTSGLTLRALHLQPQRERFIVA